MPIWTFYKFFFTGPTVFTYTPITTLVVIAFWEISFLFRKKKICFRATRRAALGAVSTVTGRVGARAVGVRGPPVFPPLGRRAAIQIFGGERDRPANQLALAVRRLNLSVCCGPRSSASLSPAVCRLFCLFIVIIICRSDSAANF